MTVGAIQQCDNTLRDWLSGVILALLLNDTLGAITPLWIHDDLFAGLRLSAH